MSTMINQKENIPRINIKDTVSALDREEVCGKEENSNEYLIIKSKKGFCAGKPHQPDFYTLSIALEGSCTEIISENKVTLSPGRLLFTSPREIITAEDCSPDLKIRQILFKKSFLLGTNLSREILDELLWVDPAKPPIFDLNDEDFKKMKYLIDKLAEEAYLSKAYHRQILRNGIIELLYRINRLDKSCLKKGDHTSTQVNRLYKKFKDLVDEHFIQKKKVSDYAELLHVTPKHLSEVVKEESNSTALEHIHGRIMREAKNQLIYTDKSAKEIAYHLGFNTPSQFGRFFKRKAGESPIQFRKSRKTEH